MQAGDEHKENLFLQTANKKYSEQLLENGSNNTGTNNSLKLHPDKNDHDGEKGKQERKTSDDGMNKQDFTSQVQQFANERSRRNPISEGPFQQIKYRQGCAAQRSGQIRFQQEKLPLRNRIYSTEIGQMRIKSIEQAQAYKKVAQELYKRGDYFDSLTQLHKAVKIFKVEKLTEQLKQDNEQTYNLIKDCYLFSASCYIKINQFESAIQLMNELLETEPINVKGLYLRGKAHHHKKDVNLAFRDFSSALKLEPTNEILINSLKTLKDESGHGTDQNPIKRKASIDLQKKKKIVRSTAGSSQENNSPKENNQKITVKNMSKTQYKEKKNDMREQIDSEFEKMLRPNSSIWNYLMQFWAKYKPEVLQVLYTVSILIILLLLKKFIQQIIPQPVKDKFKSLIC